MNVTATLDKEEVLKSIDIGAYYASEISDLGVAGPEGWTENSKCLFHDEKTGSFGVNINTGQYKCFGCDAEGDLFKFHMIRHGVDFHTALKQLADFAGLNGQASSPPSFVHPQLGQSAIVSLPDKSNKDNSSLPGKLLAPSKKGQVKYGQTEQKPKSELEEFWEGHSFVKLKGIKKLLCKSRGINEEPVDHLIEDGVLRTKQYHKKACLMVPFFTLKRKVLKAIQLQSLDSEPFSFTIKNGSPKNKVFLKGSKPGEGGIFPCGAEIDQARIVIIVESVINAMTVSQFYPDACCLALGSASYTRKIKTLKPYMNDIDKVIVVPDNDPAGEKMVDEIHEIAQDKTYVINWPDDTPKGFDVNDHLKAGQGEKITDLIDNAERLPNIPVDKKQNGLSNAGGYLEDDAAKIEKENIRQIKRLNETHAAVMVGGKFQILNEFIDPLTGKQDFSLSSVFDFNNRYANRKLQKPRSPDEAMSLAKAWIESDLRREFQGIIFDPNSTDPHFYNLWNGLAYTPKKGDWSLFQDHIFEVIADKNGRIFIWILAWLARILQDPGGERPGTALVLRGKQGTGKGLFVDFFGKLLGKHYIQVAQASQVTGRFNSHMKDALLVFVDEGFWAGDKQAEGVIKNLITEPNLTVEQKGKDIIRVQNNVNLIMASNNSWVCPAGLEERRFFVLGVSDKHQQDHAYFKAIVAQMENGGLEAMLHDLLEMDISQHNLREFEQTSGLFEQKLYSMDTVQKYWFERLREGNLRPYRLNSNDSEPGWNYEVPTVDQYEDYLEFARSINDRYPSTETQLGIELNKLCSGIKKDRHRLPGGGSLHSRRFPPLDECRAEFESLVKTGIDWEES
jgi:hypothetical protein